VSVSSLDPARTRAILIGADHFPADPVHLPALPAVANNLSALVDALTDASVLGLPHENIDVLANPSVVEMQTAIAHAAEEAEDGLIVYYAGHGLIAQGRLHLTARDSTESRIEFSGVDIQKVREAVRASPARKRIVLLDCCYSGGAMGAMSGGAKGAVASAIDDFAGSYVMTASAATQTALAPPGASHTLFTENLLAVLREGVEGAGEGLRLPVVFQAVRKRLRDLPGAPEPQQSSTQTLNMAPVFRNRSPRAVIENADNMQLVKDQLEAQQKQIAELQRRLERQALNTAPDDEAVSKARDLLAAENVRLQERITLVEENRGDEVDLGQSADRVASLGEMVGELQSAWRRYQAKEDARIRRYPWLYVWVTPVVANLLPFMVVSETTDAYGYVDQSLYLAPGLVLIAVTYFTFAYGGRRLGWSRQRIWVMTAAGNVVNGLLLLAALAAVG